MDTKSASIGIGLVAVVAAQSQSRPLLEEILERVNYAVSEMHVFVVDTLSTCGATAALGTPGPSGNPEHQTHPDFAGCI